MTRSMIIGIDFDGTLCDHRFPEIGEEVALAFKYLKMFQEAGVRLILWTMRSDGREDGFDPLTEAIEWCRERGVEFWSHNSNPEQASWTSSQKCYANLYVDDAAFGCPLKLNARSGGRPFVDWSIVGPKVLEMIQK